MIKLSYFSKIITFLLLILFLSSCEAVKYKKTEPGEVPINADDRVAKNIEEGRGFRLFDSDKEKGGNFDFASSNELWRATLDTIDFMPLVSANYSGGIIITDWYNDGETSGQSVKISVRFLTNEVRADALDIKVFTKNCGTAIDCKVIENKGTLVSQLTKSILKKAAVYEKENRKRNKKKYEYSKPQTRKEKLNKN
ncbi:DUF3576 domain-containing protein [Candidatus Pelagibacter sp.]|nr:DUF3576 domain-containing protein [Candidatus Pelagibacter sp.]|tara:strand:- start:81 stop:668 length:588 start_codon:yes stop_codon:yes gene_type:complete